MADEPKTTIVIKKIKKGGHGHHGGAWKVAYADFVTAMMVFFLAMWIVATMNTSDREKLQKIFNDPFENRLGSIKAIMGIFEANQGAQMMNTPNRGGVADTNKTGGLSKLHVLVQKIEKDMEIFKSDSMTIKSSNDQIQLAITAESLFSPGSALLKPESEPLLNRLAEILKPIEANIMVEAHTDDLPPDSPIFETNWELSAVRAATVVRFFIEGHNFDPAKLTAMGAGEFKPAGNNSTPEGRARNRRVDIYVVPQKHDRTLYRVPASEEAPE